MVNKIYFPLDKTLKLVFTIKAIILENKCLFSKYEEILNGFTGRLIGKGIISSNFSYSLVKTNLIFKNMLPSKNFIKMLEKKNLSNDLYYRSDLLTQ